METYKNNFDVLDFNQIINWHQRYEKEQEERLKNGQNFNVFDVL